MNLTARQVDIIRRTLELTPEQVEALHLECGTHPDLQATPGAAQTPARAALRPAQAPAAPAPPPPPPVADTLPPEAPTSAESIHAKLDKLTGAVAGLVDVLKGGGQ